jgi:hypothetical protein
MTTRRALGSRARDPRRRAPGRRYAADPPTVEEMVAVMRQAGAAIDGRRARALIVVALLARRVDVGDQSRIDQLAMRAERRRRPRLRPAPCGRQRRLERRPHRRRCTP